VVVLDKNYLALANRQVTLHSAPMTATTNSKGVATFTNVAPGVHHVEYTVDNKTYTQPVYVMNNVISSNDTQIAPSQNSAVVFAGFSGASHSWGAIFEPILLLFVILMVYLVHLYIKSVHKAKTSNVKPTITPIKPSTVKT
jgi:hypothetical protein